MSLPARALGRLRGIREWGVFHWLGLGTCLALIVFPVAAGLVGLALFSGNPFSPLSADIRATASATAQAGPGDAATPAAAVDPLPTGPAGPNLEILHEGATMTVINISGRTLSLADVDFRRIGQEGAFTATFSAQEWNGVGARAVNALPPGDCFQLRRPDVRQTKPANCDTIQAWLATVNREWYFWVAEQGEAYFAILQGGVVIHICPITQSRCVFYLPQP